jgi:hypothetical protein
MCSIRKDFVLSFPTQHDSASPTKSPFTIRYFTNDTKPSFTEETITVLIQHDGGANRSLTNHKELLCNYSDIPHYPIYGISSDDAALTCSGKGFIPWRAQTGDVLYVPCYYSEQAAVTIISPTDVVLSYPQV